MTVPFGCQVCGSGRLAELEAFGALPRITSDCKPFRAGGRLTECIECGATQKLPTPEWLAEISEIYRDYTPYHQAEGVEQIVLDSATGTLRRRSDVIITRLAAMGELPKSGRVLDAGCGSGATLKVFSRELPGWSLYGHEIDGKGHEHLAAIPGFRQLYTCSPQEIDVDFDMVTSIHSLEHFPSPYDMLCQIRTRIRPGGRLFVQLYNSAENLFDLLIADHLMHFTPRTLALIVERAGFEVQFIETSWITKELSLLATPSEAGQHNDDSLARFPELRKRAASVAWLRATMECALAGAALGKPLGVFGTSIAATWVASFLGESVEFFVDEDPLRQNRSYMGRAVLSPSQVPPGSRVFLALVPAVAENIQRRLQPLGIEFFSPPVR